MRRSTASAIVTGALLASPSMAGDVPAATAPQTLVQAFNDSCRKGFPANDTVAASAHAEGFQDSGQAVRNDPNGLRVPIANPRFLHRSGVMLVLMEEGGLPGMRHSCEVAATADKAIDIATLVSAVSAGTGFDTPELVQARGQDQARWHRPGGYVVEASAQKGRVHNIIMQVFQDPEKGAK